MEYSYDPVDKIIRAKAVGVVRVPELMEYLETIIRDPGIEPGFIEIVDFSDASDLAIHYRDLAPFPEIWSAYLAKGCRCVIVYAPNDTAYGVIRMLRAVLELKQDTDTENFHLTRTTAEVEGILKQLSIR